MSYNLPHATTTSHGVMQVGNNLTVVNGVVSAIGSLPTSSFFGKFFSDTTQTNPVVDTANAVTFNNTKYSQGVTNGAGSQITVVNAGYYYITVDLQAEITSGGGADIDLWLSVNGTIEPNTNSVSLLDGGGARRLVSRTFLQQFADNDFFEIYWSSPSSTMQLTATGTQTGPDRPATSSANITVVLVEATP